MRLRLVNEIIRWLSRVCSESEDGEAMLRKEKSATKPTHLCQLIRSVRAFTENAGEPFQGQNLCNYPGDQEISAYRLTYPSAVRHFETPVLR